MSKTVFERLEEVQKELKDLKEKQKTLVDQLNEDDPKIIEFVKTANRVWRYSYEKSDLKRKNNKNKKISIIGLVLLAIYLTVPFFFITKPYGWILPVFSGVVCICYYTYRFVAHFINIKFQNSCQNVYSITIFLT